MKRLGMMIVFKIVGPGVKIFLDNQFIDR